MVISGTLVVFTAAFGFVYLLLKWYHRPQNAPPGPRGIPFVGVGPFFYGSEPALTMAKYAEVYGNVMSLRMGSADFLVLGDLEAITEAFVKQASSFAGRPQSKFSLRELTGGYGLIFRDSSPQWKLQKRFGSQALRRLGMGKHLMQDRIIAELNILLETIEILDGKPFDVMYYMKRFAVNATTKLITGERYDYDGQRLQTILDGMPKKSPIMYLPWLRNIPPFKAKFDEVVLRHQNLLELVQDVVHEHEKTYDSHQHRDFIDEYLSELLKEEKDESFEYAQCYHYIVDLLVAGIDSSKASLGWGILCLIHYPECQVKIQKELDCILGASEEQFVGQLEDMHYLHAFITEVWRWKGTTPIGVPHFTKTNVRLMGYDIPANTMVLPNFWQVHNDKRFWDKPEQFKPERHLDRNGKFVRSDHVIPFSVGQRRCLGEQMAKAQHFLFYVEILRRFSFECDPVRGCPSLKTDGTSVFETPLDYFAVARPR